MGNCPKNRYPMCDARPVPCTSRQGRRECQPSFTCGRQKLQQTFGTGLQAGIKRCPVACRDVPSNVVNVLRGPDIEP